MIQKQVKISEHGQVSNVDGCSVVCHNRMISKEDGYSVSCEKFCAAFHLKKFSDRTEVWCMADRFIVGILE